jgi:hypothetical protein
VKRGSLELDDGHGGASIFFGKPLLRIYACFTTLLHNPVFGMAIYDAAGVPVSNVQSNPGTVSDELTVEAYFPNISLYPGRYLFSPWIMDATRQRDIDFPRLCATFDIHPAAGTYGGLKLDKDWGQVFLPAQWIIGGRK